MRITAFPASATSFDAPGAVPFSLCRRGSRFPHWPSRQIRFPKEPPIVAFETFRRQQFEYGGRAAAVSAAGSPSSWVLSRGNEVLIQPATVHALFGRRRVVTKLSHRTRNALHESPAMGAGPCALSACAGSANRRVVIGRARTHLIQIKRASSDVATFGDGRFLSDEDIEPPEDDRRRRKQSRSRAAPPGARSRRSLK